MAQVTFTDPKTGATYSWTTNPPPDGIQPSSKVRQIERTSNTGNVGATKQQGDDGPYIMAWNVNVFTEAQEIALWEWYRKCEKQTIYLTDWGGNQYEGQIIELGDQWTGVLSGPGDARDRQGYSRMTFQFEVYRFISGKMATAGVTP